MFRSACMVSVIGLCGVAMASLQPGTVTAGGRQWKPAEATVGDMNPISASQRVVPVDMRMATNFERLYQLDSKPREFAGPSNDYYMRMNGGVMAIFPRSTYVETKEGVRATVPPGAVYSLGGNLDHILGERAQPEPTPENERRIDHSARPRQPEQAAPRPNAPMPVQPQRPGGSVRPDYRVRPDTGPAAEQPSAQPGSGDRPAPGAEARPRPAASSDPLPPSIWFDEAYRRTRVSELLDQASRAGR